MMIRIKHILACAFAVFLLCSCSSGSTENSDHKVSTSDIEKAKIAGREAARTFINQKWQDTLRRQEQLVIAGSKAAQYYSLPQLRAAFDSAFISTVRTVRPEIAEKLERYSRENAK